MDGHGSGSGHGHSQSPATVAAAAARKASVATTASSSSKARTERGPRTHRGLTCANCRARKTRCDGTQPTCKTCEVYQDECRYEKPPPMSQIVAMAKRLQEAEQTILDLRKALETRPSPEQTPRNSDLSSNISAASSEFISAQELPQGAQDSKLFRQARSPSKEPTEELLSDLSLDEHGKIIYLGPTSAVHDPPALESASPEAHHYAEAVAKSDARTLLTSNAQESRAWEGFALGNASMQTGIPQATIARLLQIHWAWIAPMFMWVYRPAFMRDMSTGGPYYSPFLLTVLCAHSARFHERKLGESLISRARLLLGTEIHRPSSIPTVQALLQLSTRDMAFGSISQAWLYSGMAFRMVIDLGLHHNSGKIVSLGYLGAEELEIRRRLFWSCYFWDKAISLYLGRMPALSETPLDSAPELLDDYAENEVWSPYFGDSLNLSKTSPGEYPPLKSYSISCFENSCKLAVIINDIILHLYSRRSTPEPDETLRGIRERLDSWREECPPHLKIEPHNVPDVCPPPHILTQNLLFFATIILLHRPFYSIPAHHAACRAAAESVERLLLLLEKTFGFTRITYLIAYCIYTGASAMVQDVKAGDMQASIKMQTFLRALKQGQATCPLLQRSLEIINNGLRSEVPQHNPNAGDMNGESLLSRHYLPAFPYRDFQMEFHDVNNMGGMDLDSFSLLDSYPENHINTEVGAWYLPSQV